MNQGNVALREREAEIIVTERTWAGRKVEYKEKRVYSFIKRAFDITASLLALIVLSPLFLIVMLLIFVTDPGNPFFVQQRVGKDGKIFNIYKFRSMHKDAEKGRKDLLIHN